MINRVNAFVMYQQVTARAGCGAEKTYWNSLAEETLAP
jgi:hypothetical protein